MRCRLSIELPSHDPDAQVIRLYLQRLPARRRAEMVRKILASGCRVLLRSGSGHTRRAAPRAGAPTPPAPLPTPPAVPEVDAADERITAVTKRYRLPLITGGIRYDELEHSSQSPA